MALPTLQTLITKAQDDQRPKIEATQGDVRRGIALEDQCARDLEEAKLLPETIKRSWQKHDDTYTPEDFTLAQAAVTRASLRHTGARDFSRRAEETARDMDTTAAELAAKVVSSLFDDAAGVTVLWTWADVRDIKPKPSELPAVVIVQRHAAEELPSGAIRAEVEIVAHTPSYMTNPLLDTRELEGAGVEQDVRLVVRSSGTNRHRGQQQGFRMEVTGMPTTPYIAEVGPGVVSRVALTVAAGVAHDLHNRADRAIYSDPHHRLYKSTGVVAMAGGSILTSEVINDEGARITTIDGAVLTESLSGSDVAAAVRNAITSLSRRSHIDGLGRVDSLELVDPTDSPVGVDEQHVNVLVREATVDLAMNRQTAAHAYDSGRWAQWTFRAVLTSTTKPHGGVRTEAVKLREELAQRAVMSNDLDQHEPADDRDQHSHVPGNVRLKKYAVAQSAR